MQDFVANVGQPARPYIFSVVIPGISMATFKAQTAQWPGVGSTDIDLFYKGQTIKYAGAVEYEHTWTCQIVESEVGDIYAGLYSWRQLVWSQSTGISAPPALYKREIVLQARTTLDSIWLSGVLHGAYPKTIDPVELDTSANTESWKWNITFSYDWWDLI